MKLIDKRELMELLDDMFSRYDGTPSVMEGFKYGLDAVISEVSVMPTIDAEPVIRCKDCNFCGEIDENGWHCCENLGVGMQKNGFCSDAERREDEDAD